ncbi:MAG: hypothetical protein M1819_003132 [Sarea resinae]|nr:MAG: hypothetical protein M1819_003132 [Sarea resinae]
MPASSDELAGHSHPYPNLGPHYQPSQTSRLAGGQPRGRNRKKKFERPGEQNTGSALSRIYPREITKSPPSLLPARHRPPTSPLLDALGTVGAVNNNSAAYHTSEWAKSLPFFPNSQPVVPNNGVSISGSPPNLPLSFGEGGFHNASPSTSPSGRNSRPLSHPKTYQSFDNHFQPSFRQSPGRRTSMHSQHPQMGAWASQPPLPHQPQAHFYGAPEIDLDLPGESVATLMPGENGYMCGFDTLGTSGRSASESAENVLLVGSEGGFDIFKVEQEKLETVAKIRGLRGGVIDAKILAWTAQDDPFVSLRPLVALIIHGPVIPEDPQEDESAAVERSDIEQDEPDSSPGRSPSGGSPTASKPAKEITHYQTTVEVYCLSNREHVVTLFSSPAIPISNPITSPLFSPPPPIGNLTVDANGRFVVIASGSSGEVFIYGVGQPYDGSSSSGFRCLGKVWTATQTRNRDSHSSSSSSAGADNICEDPVAGVRQVAAPLFSLSHRWLAVVPPSPSNYSSLNGQGFLAQSQVKPPGFDSHTPPSQPQTNCTVETPEGESLFNRMARGVTQEVIKGARWVGDQGKQAWRNYWNKSSPPNDQTRMLNGFPQARDDSRLPPQNAAQYFPPTHAHSNQATQDGGEQAVVSIFDLQKVMDSPKAKSRTSIDATATFPAPFGCSFVSFSPTGLALLTASKKGDVQFIWDLMRMAHSRAMISSDSAPDTAEGSRQGPLIRQIARYTRMTVASIVDVSWKSPRGDSIAIVTEKGTIHVFELPRSAFQWPPPRRVVRTAKSPSQVGDGDASNQKKNAETSENAVSAAINMLNGKTQPLFAAVKGRRSSLGTNLSGMGGLSITSAAGAKGGKYVAAGFSKSLGAATGTVNHLRNAADNRLHLPGASNRVAPGCVRWLTGKENGCIGIVGGGMLRIYPARQRAIATGKSNRRQSLAGAMPIEFGLLAIPDEIIAPVVLDRLRTGNNRNSENGRHALEGFWNLRSPIGHVNDTVVAGAAKSNPHPLSYAEIETNPPYQPFHTDRRIGLYVYNQPPSARWPSGDLLRSDHEDQSSAEIINIHHTDENDATPWVFGEAIPATKINVGPTVPESSSEDLNIDSNGASSLEPDRMENTMKLREGGDGDEEVEQIVVTTRRRKRVRTNGDNVGADGQVIEEQEGFFEDDCEVLDFAADRV